MSSSPSSRENAQFCSTIAIATSTTAKIISPHPSTESSSSAPANQQRCSRPRVTTGNAHDLDSKPSVIPPPIQTAQGLWLYSIGERRFWVRSRAPVDWKHWGMIIKDKDLGYDSDETIDDPDYMPMEVEDQGWEMEIVKGDTIDKDAKDDFDKVKDEVNGAKPLKKGTWRRRRLPASFSSSQGVRAVYTSRAATDHEKTEAANDSNTKRGETIDDKKQDKREEANRTTFQAAVRKRRAWNLENEEESVTKVPLPKYDDYTPII